MDKVLSRVVVLLSETMTDLVRQSSVPLCQLERHFLLLVLFRVSLVD